MAYYDKTLTEVVRDIIDNIHDALPEADTREGTFIRDVFVDPISDEISTMYLDMRMLKLSQSVLTAVGDDLDYLAANYFVERKMATKATGTVRFYIDNSTQQAVSIDDLEEYYEIPVGTVVSTTGSYTQDAVEFLTTTGLYYTAQEIKSLSIDQETGYRYIETSCEAYVAGETGNISAGEINILSSSIPGIAFVSNPYAFSGGTNAEDDAALANRVQLAITGCNIGTKDGYLRYILNQPYVIAAKIVGAGDSIMFRDGGYVDDDNVYHYGIGGCVDIYVRGHNNSEKRMNLLIDSDYVNNDYPDIIFPSQPVTSITSIINSHGETFVNAENFEQEKSTSKNSSGEAEVTIQYCEDMLWDFSITDSFPDTEYYSLPTGLTQEQIAQLKVAVDAELNNALTYMSNLIYTIDWGNVYTVSTDGGSTKYFNKIYYNGKVYKLIAKKDSGLDGRMFIMKNDRIYLRIYHEPDYIIKKDTTDYAGSMTATDAIHWLSKKKLYMNDTITIKYNYDYLIETLQGGIENVRCLTADVLVKQAVEIPVEIIASFTCYTYKTLSSIKNSVYSDISYWINTLQNLGGSFDRSDIVALIKQTAAVDKVDISSLTIAVKGYDPQETLTCADNEYFIVSNIVLNASYNTVINT